MEGNYQQLIKDQLSVMRKAIGNHEDVENPMFDYLRSVPYNVSRTELYSSGELFDKFTTEDESSADRCYDTVVYKHSLKTGKYTHLPFEMAARNMHDLGVRLAMEDFLSQYKERQVVGIMGGHSLPRTSAIYRQALDVSKKLTEQGYLMISGGGPGAMEATHLGAWMAGRSEEDVDEAIRILSVAQTSEDSGWLSSAFEVMKRFPLLGDYKSLSIPTWLYGHEPPAVFATHIAKLFENSIREDALLKAACGGLIYFEGSAGTLQEVFQEVVQDYYVCMGYPSPMVFVGRKFWNEDVPVAPFIDHMLKNKRYDNLLVTVVDETDEIIESITDFKGLCELMKNNPKFSIE